MPDDPFLRLAIAAAGAFVLALAFTPVVRAAAHRFGLVAPPRDDRWHRRPTALLGGIAIYLAFVVTCVALLPAVPGAGAVLLGASILFLGGLVDDVRPMRPYVKLILQFCAAGTIVYLGLRLPWTQNELVDNAITIFWLVGITNALNLLDNMDGLAGGITIIASVFMAITFILIGQLDEALLPVMLGAAVLGFLVYNWHPASIFMGDAGSMFLGLALGGTALLSDHARSRSLAAVLFTPVLILLIPILDTTLVTITRKLAGRPIAQGGRDHTSHRLVAMGLSERRAVVTLFVLATVSGAMALLVGVLEEPFIWLLVPTFILGIAGVAIFLGHVRVSDAEVQPQRDSTVVRVFEDIYGKRRIFEVMLDVGLIVLAYYGAYVLRYEGSIPPGQAAIMGRTLPLVIVITALFLLLGGVYRAMWRYVGVDELVVLARSVGGGALVSALVVFALNPGQPISRSTFVLEALLLLLFIGGSRLSYRVMRVLVTRQTSPPPGARPVIIYGAGDGGELVMREILNNPGHLYAPVGFIDDDGRKAGRSIHGYRIFRSQDLPDLIRRHGVEEILVSTRQVPEGELDALRRLGVRPRRVSIDFE